jgi:hypothetical protein
MGTWGTGPFEDDNASDWAWELEEADDWSVVETALRAAAEVPGDAYLEAPDGQIAWAAAAVVAASENPSEVPLPDELRAWLDRHQDSRPSQLRPLALAATQRVLADNSELVELWRDEGEDEWRANVEGLTRFLA